MIRAASFNPWSSMTSASPADRSSSAFLIVGAGAAGLMAAYKLAHAGKKVVVLEARDRCGGRIEPLSAAEFGYAAEGGAEFVHGAAPHTRALMREAGLSFEPLGGSAWHAESGVLASDERSTPHAGELRRALSALKTDLPVAEFLATQFADARYAELRRSITRMVEGYDAADTKRASTFALREEWMGRERGQQGRVAGGYGALIAFMRSACLARGVALHCQADVIAIESSEEGMLTRCRDGRLFRSAAVILTVPLPMLGAIAMPPGAAAKAARAVADIGFGNVVKILLRFASRWWATAGGQDLADLSFLFSTARVPTWWTQHPAKHAVLTGWLAGPRADAVAGLSEDELIEVALGALAENFAIPQERLRQQLVAARAINWGADPFARGAYSYATPQTRAVLEELETPESHIWFSGEAFYSGPDMGTVEAAFASARRTVEAILAGGR